MIDDKYLFDCADRIVEIYDELNNFAVKDIIRRIVKADWQMTGTAELQIMRLQESGYLLTDLQKEVAKITKKSDLEIKSLFEEAGIEALKYDDAVYIKAGLKPIPLMQSERMLNVLQGAIKSTQNELNNFTNTTASQVQSLFTQKLDEIYWKVQSGQQSYSQAILNAVNDISKSGVVVNYPSGRADTIETAVRRATMTGINQGTSRLQEARMDELEIDLVYVSQHANARATGDGPKNHASWQGKVYSRSGTSKKYPSFIERTGYGTATGLCGVNCRHHFFAFVDGVNTIPERINEAEARKGYEMSQKQRLQERQIRAYKRQLQGYDTAIQNSGDEALKLKLQTKYDAVAVKLREKNTQYKEFCKDNNLKTQQERLQIADWNRSQSMKALQAAKRQI